MSFKINLFSLINRHTYSLTLTQIHPHTRTQRMIMAATRERVLPLYDLFWNIEIFWNFNIERVCKYSSFSMGHNRLNALQLVYFKLYLQCKYIYISVRTWLFSSAIFCADGATLGASCSSCCRNNMWRLWLLLRTAQLWQMQPNSLDIRSNYVPVFSEKLTSKNLSVLNFSSATQFCSKSLLTVYTVFLTNTRTHIHK